MIKNIVFDWSGVINDNVNDVLRTINGMYGELGEIQISKKELREKWVQPYMKFHRKYYPKLSLKRQKELYGKYIVMQNGNKSFCGMRKLVRELKQKGFRLFVLSGDQPQTPYKELREYELEGLFEKVYCDFHDKGTVVEKLMNENNLKPEQTAFVGDTHHEIEVGKKVGSTTIAVSWGFSSVKKLKESQPDRIARSATELGKILQG